MELPSLSSREQALQESLLAQGLLSPTEWQEILTARKQAWDQALESLNGRQAEISLETGSLCLRSFPDLQLKNSLALEIPIPQKNQASWGRDMIGLNPEDGRLLEWFSLPETYAPQFLIPDSGEISLGFSRPDQPFLGASLAAFDLRHSSQAEFNPCDLFISPGKRLLLLSDRKAGSVEIVSLLTGRSLAKVPIRPAGSLQAINITFSPDEQWAYLTDQITTNLHILELGSFRIRSLQTGLGTLGNLVLAPDPRYLFLLVIKPSLRLLYFEIESFQIVQELNLKGNAFSQVSDAPTDLMHLSPDQAYLSVLTSLDEPAPLTPVVNVIRTETIKTIRRFAIKDGCRPAALVTGLPNPLQETASRSLNSWLESKVPAAEIRRMQSPLAAAPSTQKKASAPAYQAPLAPPLSEAESAELLKRQAPPISLPAEAENALVELMVQAFYQETLTHLRVHPVEIRRLRQCAHELKLELEQKYAVMAEVDGILGQYHLKTLITRDALVQATGPLMAGEAKAFSPEKLCPICEAPLQGSELCQACGFKITAPQKTSEATHLSPSSEAFDHLLQGQLLICQPENAELMLLNNWHKPLWSHPAQSTGFTQPVHALSLPNHRYLLTDQAGKILELNSLGKICWESKIALNQPRLSSLSQENGEDLFLIVEATRIIALDREQKIRYAWGPETGLELKSPRDIQLTPQETCLITDQEQVLEINMQGEILFVWGSKQGLKKPISARRLKKGTVQIIDAERREILLFNQAELLSHFSYWPPEKPTPAMEKAPVPETALYTPTGDVILLSTHYWMQIQPELKKIRWTSPLPRSHKENLRQVTQKKGQGPAKAPVSPHIALLQQVSFLADANMEMLELLAQKLKPLRLPKGEWVLHEKELGSAMFFIAQGEVDVIKEDSQSKLATLGAGDVFGEMALILSEPRSAGVQARSELELLQLERSDFKNVIVRFPALARELRVIAHKRKLLSQQLKTSRNQDVLSRLKSKMAVNKLRELAFFAGGEAPFYDTLAKVLRPVAYLPEQEVFHQGESGDTLFFISRGAVGVYIDESPLPDYELSVGDVFGEMAVILEQPRNASVKTLGYCQFYELDRASFAHVCQQFPDFAERLRKLAEQREAMNLQERALNEVREEVQPLTLNTSPLFYISPLQEKIVGLTPQGALQTSWGESLHLFQPFRLSPVEENLLVCDTGNDRILLVDPQTQKILHEWGDHRLELQQPRSAVKTQDGFYLIADEGNQRLIAVDTEGKLLWEHTTPNEILSPYYAEFTPSETILFADAALHTVQEVNRIGEVLWSYGSLLIAGSGPDELCEPMCVRRLPQGETLIADSGNNRLLWVNSAGGLLRSWHPPADSHFSSPVHCEPLPSGEILVSAANSETLVLLSAEGDLLWEQTLKL